MRVIGYLMLVAGALFIIMFVLAEFGGARLNVAPFITCAILIFVGWRFAQAGAGLARATAVASSGATVEVPMSPAAAAAIGQQNAKSWRIVLILSGAMFAFFAILGAILAFLDTRPGESGETLIIFGAVGLATACMVLGISWASTRRLMDRDLRTATYLRTTGPVRVVPLFNSAILRLADRAFVMQGNVGVRELGALQNGTVDYSPYGHVVLAAWDASGRHVYSAPGYEAASGAPNRSSMESG